MRPNEERNSPDPLPRLYLPPFIPSGSALFVLRCVFVGTATGGVLTALSFWLLR